LIGEGTLISILASRPISETSPEEIARVKEQYVRFLGLNDQESIQMLNNQEFITSTDRVTPVEESESSITGTEEGEGEGGGREETSTDAGSGRPGPTSPETRVETRRMNAEIRRERILEEVSSKGVLGQLTGVGSTTRGLPVINPFSSSEQDEGVGDDLDPILSSVNGLKTGGQSSISAVSGSGVRGERSDRQITIDDMVTDLGTKESTSISRKGELVVESPADVRGRGRKSIYRSQAAIHEVIYSHLPAIRYCYERELKKFPNLKGKIDVRVTIGADGGVKEAVLVSSTMNNSRVERCILARIRLWKNFQPINPDDGDVTFRQSFAFGY
jgi:hypothetical protein